MRGELGGESGMKRFPSTIGTLEDEPWEVELWLRVWLKGVSY